MGPLHPLAELHHCRPEQFGATREDIRLALEAGNIESRPVWKPMHLQPVFAGGEVVGRRVAEALFRDGLCLPSGTALTEDLDRVVRGYLLNNPG